MVCVLKDKVLYKFDNFDCLRFFEIYNTFGISLRGGIVFFEFGKGDI